MIQSNYIIIKVFVLIKRKKVTQTITLGGIISQVEPVKTFKQNITISRSFLDSADEENKFATGWRCDGLYAFVCVTGQRPRVCVCARAFYGCFRHRSHVASPAGRPGVVK